MQVLKSVIFDDRIKYLAEFILYFLLWEKKSTSAEMLFKVIINFRDRETEGVFRMA